MEVPHSMNLRATRRPEHRVVQLLITLSFDEKLGGAHGHLPFTRLITCYITEVPVYVELNSIFYLSVQA